MLISAGAVVGLGATSRLAENRASLAVTFETETSERTRLSGAVELQRVTVGDHDEMKVGAVMEIRMQMKPVK